jgi:beta-N-acetylhexosaminidase
VIRRRRLVFGALAVVALAAWVAGLVVGAGRGDGDERTRADRRAGSSFLAEIVPRPARRRDGKQQPASGGRAALPLERKVAQVFAFGFTGTDLNAAIYRRLRQLDLGAIVLDAENYTDSSLLALMAGEAAVIAEQEGHVRPLVLARQQGGELNAFADLPPASPPADLASAAGAAAQAADSAATLRGLDVTGVLGPALDVGFEGASAVGPAAYSDDPGEVAAFARAVVGAYRKEGVLAAVEHFPGLGSADQPTDEGPASVGLDLEQLRTRDVRPFRAAFRAGAQGVVLSHALYPMNDFTAPASLSKEVVSDLLRGELGFRGVAITDDLAAPAVAVAATVPQAAVRALRAGADMLFVSGPEAEQQAAYDAVLAAARRGRLARGRLDEAVTRILLVKRALGLIP